MIKFEQALTWLALVVTFALTLFCLVIYGVEVIRSFGASDKSLLFWYLPFLFVGLLSARAFLATWRRLASHRR